MYHKGTIEEFNSWHNSVMNELNLPTLDSVDRNKYKATAYSSKIKHPTLEEYIWLYGDYPMDGKEIFTNSQLKELGWFEEEKKNV